MLRNAEFIWGKDLSEVKFADKIRVMSNDKQVYYKYKQKRNEILSMEMKETFEKKRREEFLEIEKQYRRVPLVVEK